MANNNKQIWMTILIAAVVGILSSAITVSIISKNVLLGPQESLKVIRANSCDADGLCEINNFTAMSGEVENLGVLQKLSTNDIESGADINIFSAHGGIILNGYSDGVTIVGLRNIMNNTNVAFVCADVSGKLFRKSTPCI